MLRVRLVAPPAPAAPGDPDPHGVATYGVVVERMADEQIWDVQQQEWADEPESFISPLRSSGGDSPLARIYRAALATPPETWPDGRYAVYFVHDDGGDPARRVLLPGGEASIVAGDDTDLCCRLGEVLAVSFGTNATHYDRTPQGLVATATVLSTGRANVKITPQRR